MRTLIYQCWTGPERSGWLASKANMEAYAARIGATYEALYEPRLRIVPKKIAEAPVPTAGLPSLELLTQLADRDINAEFHWRLGKTIALFVNTRASAFTLEVFRIGWYGGAGARRVFGPHPQGLPTRLVSTRVGLEDVGGRQETIGQEQSIVVPMY